MFKIAFAAALLAATAPAAAAVYDTAATTPGNQSWSGTLGLDFHVSTAIQITDLGVFDSGKDGITTDITAAIFSSNGSMIGPAINFNGTANAGGNAYVFKSVTPFNLGVGDYQIGAWNYNNTDQNYNSNGGASLINFDTLGGKVSATSSHYADQGDGGVLAYHLDNGALRYGAGSFIATAVPHGSPIPPPPPPPVQSPGVYHGGSDVSANQNWTGTLGLDFTVIHGIRVTSLGVFAGGRSSVNADLYTGIFNSSGALVTPVVDFNGTANPGNDAFVFQSIASVYLAPGTYQVGSWGFGGTMGDYNSQGAHSLIGFNDLHGALTNDGSRYADPGVSGVLATNVDSSLSRYGAGSFLATVPEPSQWGLLLGGFLMTGFAMRRRKVIAA